MKLRTLYGIGAFVWALPLGFGVALSVFAVAAGASWLFVFGDDPWPDWAGLPLLLLPIAAGLAAIAALTALGWRFGRSTEGAAQLGRPRRRGALLLVSGLGAWLAVALLANAYLERQGEERRLAEQQESALAHLLETRHVIDGVSVAPDANGHLLVSLSLAGTRSGPYRLSWQLEEPTYDVILQEGAGRHDLTTGSGAIALALDRRELAEGYREGVLKGSNAPVLVDTRLRLHLALEPVLLASEGQTLPPREIENLGRGLSVLRQETTAEVPLSLDLTGS